MSTICTNMYEVANKYANKNGSRFNRITVMFTHAYECDNKYYIVPIHYLVQLRNRAITYKSKFLLPQSIAGNHIIEITKNQYDIINNHKSLNYFALSVKYQYINEEYSDDIEIISEKITYIKHKELIEMMHRIDKYFPYVNNKYENCDDMKVFNI